MEKVYGNLIERADEGLYDVIVHGCNCRHVMAAGIARQLRHRWPQVYGADCATVKGTSKLGLISTAQVSTLAGTPLVVVNAYTQPYPGPFFSLDALEVALRMISQIYGDKQIGLPQIGAGLGGGNWNEIEPLIEEMIPHAELVIYKP